jgi:hypothetical protein
MRIESHPAEESLLPLSAARGAAGDDEQTKLWIATPNRSILRIDDYRLDLRNNATQPCF